MSEQNKAVVRRIVDELWNKGSLAVVDELVATNYVGHFVLRPEPLRGRAAFNHFASGFFAGFPDLHFNVEDVIAEGDKVVARWTATATHQGELMGIPATGKPVTLSGTWIHRIVGGQIVEQWGVFDTLGMMQQLGVIPPMGEGGE